MTDGRIPLSSTFVVTAALIALIQVGASPGSIAPFQSVIGDGGPATSAWLRWPHGIGLDDAGALYIADQFSNRIRKVTTAGIITTIAGTGESGYRGDGGPATAAMFNFPQGVTIDKAGAIFIADTNNNRIRKVDRNGVISTFAGDGVFGFSGDGGPATAAQIRHPFCLAFDSAGNLLIGTEGSIRRVTAVGVISTVAGTGERGFSGDGGPATTAQLGEVLSIAVDKAGNIYTAGDWRVRKITAGGIISSVFGSGPPGPPIESVAIDGAGNLYVGISGMIRKFESSGANVVIAGNGERGYSGDGGPASAARLSTPGSLAIDGAGNLVIADYVNYRIRRITGDGVIQTIAGNGNQGPSSSAALSDPIGVAVDAAGNIFVSEETANRIQKITPDGIVSTIVAQIARPVAIAIDSDGNIFSNDNNRIRKIARSGTGSIIEIQPSVVTGRQFQTGGIAVDNAGNLFVADLNGRILKVTTGSVTTVVGEATPPLFRPTFGLAVGSAQELLVVDSVNNRVVKISRDSVISTVAGNGAPGFSGDGGPATEAQLQRPMSVALDRLGNIYISDTGNNRIRKITSDGIIHTVAGNGVNDLGGDGGSALAAELNSPMGIALDAAGNLFIADGRNHRIRKVTPAGIISTVGGN